MLLSRNLRLVAVAVVSEPMPREIHSAEEFTALLPRAVEVRVKRLTDVVKVKLRTPQVLYTFKCDPATADRLLSGLKVPIVNL